MKRVITPLVVAAAALLGACGGGGGAASGPGTAASGSGLESSAPADNGDTDAPGQSAGGSGSGSAGVAGSSSPEGTGAPFAEEGRDGDDVEFVTTSSTTTTTSTTTTLPPTTTSTTSTTTTSTTSTSTTSTSTSSTSTTTTVPPPTTMQCSFAADALFEPGESVLTDQSIAGLGRVVAGIADVRSVRVEGHTDHRGTDGENQALSQARADAAAAALVDSGVEESLITAVGLGETDAHQDGPSGGPTDEEMASDRRVDVIVDAEVPITTSC